VISIPTCLLVNYGNWCTSQPFSQHCIDAGCIQLKE
jgi:hypothetical protein